jgi:hypothetical protein
MDRSSFKTARVQDGAGFRDALRFWQAHSPDVAVRSPDRILDFYDLMCSKGSFQNPGLTFEQFLRVIAVLKSPELCPGAAAVAKRRNESRQCPLKI